MIKTAQWPSQYHMDPRRSERCFTVRFESKRHQFCLQNFHYTLSLLDDSGLDISLLEDSIQRVNQVIRPTVATKVRTEKILWLSTLFGILITAVLAIILGVLVTYLISIAIALVFIACFLIFHWRMSRKTRQLALKYHFNLSLVIRNENDRLYKYYGLRARPGEHGRWIEFHSVTNAPLDDIRT